MAADTNHFPIAGIALSLEGSDNTFCNRIHTQNPGAGVEERSRRCISDLLGTFPEPQSQVFKGKHSVYIIVVTNIGSLVLFGNAGAGKHHFDLFAKILLQQTGMSDHRRNYRCHLIDQTRMITFHHPIERRTASRDNILHLVFLDQLMILCCDISCTFRGFRYPVKAQSLESPYKHLGIGKIEGSKEGRSQRKDHLLPSANKFFYQFQIAGNCLCILGTYIQAGSAQHTGFFHNLCLFIFHLNGLYRTRLYTLIAVFAVCFFQT